MLILYLKFIFKILQPEAENTIIKYKSHIPHTFQKRFTVQLLVYYFDASMLTVLNSITFLEPVDCMLLPISDVTVEKKQQSVGEDVHHKTLQNILQIDIGTVPKICILTNQFKVPSHVDTSSAIEHESRLFSLFPRSELNF